MRRRTGVGIEGTQTCRLETLAFQVGCLYLAHTVHLLPRPEVTGGDPPADEGHGLTSASITPGAGGAGA